MAIRYEVHAIENSQGTGEERKYIQLRTSKAKSLDEMAGVMEHSCMATKADIKAVLAELSHFAINELAQGNRVYLPEIGYLSLAVGNVPPEKIPNGKITGNEIFLRGVNFQPEAQFVRQLREKVTFRKSDYSTVSSRYTEDQMWQMVSQYLAENKQITRRVMCGQFGLTDYMAKRWLARFVEDGRLTMHTFGKQQLYSLANPS